MSEVNISAERAAGQRAAVQPLPANITSAQPGGGVCYQVEMAWGRWRRWYLRRFRPGYVRRMAALRHGDATGAAARNSRSARFEVLPQPVHLPLGSGRRPVSLARQDSRLRAGGYVELQLMGLPLLAATVALALTPVWYLAVVPGVMLGAGRVVLSRSAAARARRAGSVGLARRRQSGRDRPAGSSTISLAGRPCGSAFSCRSSTCISIAPVPQPRVIRFDAIRRGSFSSAGNPESCASATRICGSGWRKKPGRIAG